MDNFNKSLNLRKLRLEEGNEFRKDMEQYRHDLIRIHWMGERI